MGIHSNAVPPILEHEDLARLFLQQLNHAVHGTRRMAERDDPTDGVNPDYA